ncbi:MAG: metal-sensing transcriptional repressor [Synergistaceae bacterium]
MHDCINKDTFHKRINKIIGQLNAINTMIDKDEECEKILTQISAAKSALHKAGQQLIEGHLHHCVKDGIKHGDAEKTINDFTKALEYFSRMS